MLRLAILLTGTFLFLSGITQAQQCLHADNQIPYQRQRRMDAVNALRTLNTAQYQNRTSAQRFVTFSELVFSSAWAALNRSGKLSSAIGTDLLSGFELHLTTDGTRYSISLKDMTDPCGFTLYTNDVGIIYMGYPIDYLVIPSRP